MGRRTGNRLLRIFLSTLILAILAGCAPARFRAHPQLEERVQAIRTVAVMPPGVRVYQLSVGDTTELLDKQTETAKQVVATAIEKEVVRHAGVVFKPFPSPSAILDTTNDLKAAELKAELEDTQALFEAVSASVLLHTYGIRLRASKWETREAFPEKRKDFDYSLGPKVEQLAKFANADALLFTSGVDHISTGGRKALMFLGALLTFGRGALPEGLTTLSVALVDAKTGALLWYNAVHASGTYTLTDPIPAAFLADWVFENFPVGTRPPTRNEYDRSGWPSGPSPR